MLTGTGRRSFVRRHRSYLPRLGHPVGVLRQDGAERDGLIYCLALCAVVVFNFVTNKAEAPWIYLGITLVMAMLAGAFGPFRRQPISGISVPCGSGENAVFLAQRRREASASITLLSRQWADRFLVGAVGGRCIGFGRQSAPWSSARIDAFRQIAQHQRASTLREFCWVDDQKAWLTKKERDHLREIQFLEPGIAACDRRLLRYSHRSCIADGHPGWRRRFSLEAWVKPDNYSDLWQAALGFSLEAASPPAASLREGRTLSLRSNMVRKAHLRDRKSHAG